MVDLRGIQMGSGGWQEVTRWLRKIGTVETLLLSNARISGEFNLNNLTVRDAIAFDGVECDAAVRIRGCRFRHASFSGSEFQETVRFGGVEFEEDADFIDCTFEDMLFFGEGLQVGRITLSRGVNFDWATARHVVASKARNNLHASR